MTRGRDGIVGSSSTAGVSIRRSRVANAFLFAGLAVGLVTAVALALDVVPVLSPFLMKVVIFKLAFIGAAVLLAAGATMHRRAGRAEDKQAVGRTKPR